MARLATVRFSASQVVCAAVALTLMAGCARPSPKPPARVVVKGYVNVPALLDTHPAYPDLLRLQRLRAELSQASNKALPRVRLDSETVTVLQREPRPDVAARRSAFDAAHEYLTLGLPGNPPPTTTPEQEASLKRLVEMEQALAKRYAGALADLESQTGIYARTEVESELQQVVHLLTRLATPSLRAEERPLAEQ